VRYDRSRPAKNEVVVVRRPEDDTPIVKRVIGLPGETLRIVQGDVFIDRQRLRPSEARPPEVVLFDDRWHQLEDRFDIGADRARLWRRNGSEWILDARDLAPDSGAALLRLGGPLDDGYLGPDHELVHGQTQANDAHFTCEVRFDEPGGAVRIGLKEQADTFEVVLSRANETTGEFAITRRKGDGVPETLATAHFPLMTGQWAPISFENRDNTLKVGYPGPGSPLVVPPYKENTPEGEDALATGTGPAGRVYFGGAGGRFAFRSIRLARDLVYTDRGRIGVESEIQLGPDEYFLLGDDSSQSRDSREWGPVALRDIVGRAVRVVWPPSRWRGIDVPER
jgi:signal peptidase I